MHRELACVAQMLDADVRLEDTGTYIEAGIRPPDDAREWWVMRVRGG